MCMSWLAASATSWKMAFLLAMIIVVAIGNLGISLRARALTYEYLHRKLDCFPVTRCQLTFARFLPARLRPTSGSGG